MFRASAWNGSTAPITPLTSDAVKTLYPAPRPARGLAICRLANDLQSGAETAFVYWVSAERRTLEVPNLDTPGQYIDLYRDPQHPHGQHVAVVPVEEMAGTAWGESDEDLALTFSTGEDVVVFDPVRKQRTQGQQQVDQIRTDGQQQAEGIKNRASADKQDRIADANRRLHNARG